MRIFLLFLFFPWGCTSHIYATQYMGPDEIMVFDLICDQKAGPIGCLNWANGKCRNAGSAIITSASRDPGLPGLKIEKIIDDPSLRPGQTKMTGRCARPFP